MVINETLARGLKDRFFHDFATEISAEYHKELRSMSLRTIKRGKWVKATRAVLDRLERFTIATRIAIWQYGRSHQLRNH